MFRHANAGRGARVVGVAADLKHDDLAGRRAPEVYVPAAQHANSWMFAAVRGSSEPRSLAGALRAAVREADPDQPIHNVMTMRQRLEDSVAPQRFNAALLAAFAVVALVLASVGVFGVMSYTVDGGRTRSVADGWARRPATSSGSSSARPKLPLAGRARRHGRRFPLTRLMGGLLFEVRPADPAVFAASAAAACASLPRATA